MTTVNGTYKACGTDASLTYTCTGPNCDILNGYPSMTCTTNGDVLSCNNGVTCAGPSNYTDVFTLSQPDIKVTSSDNIILSDLCEEIIYTSDGTQAGTDCHGVEMGNCTPIVSLSTATSGTTAPYSNTSTTHSVETSTILSTKTYTITSCPATVTNCPIGSVATEVFTAYTTYCPGSGATITPSGGGLAYTSAPGKTASTPAGSASSTFSQVQASGAIRRRLPSAGLIWCGLLLFFFFLAPGALALQDSSPRGVAKVPKLEHAVVRDLLVKDPRSYELQKRGLFQDFEGMANAVVQYYEGKIPSSDLGQTLVQSLESAVCDFLSSKLLTQGAAWLVDQALGVEIVAECMEIINGIVIATAPEIEVTPGGALLLNFAAKQVCNKMIQMIFHIPQAVNDICSLTKPCTKDFTSDPNHCGRCSISVSTLDPRFFSPLII